MSTVTHTDHNHTCCVCGMIYPCVHFRTLKKCQATGVFRAVAVNGQGPYCDVCRPLIEACRAARGRDMVFKQVKNRLLMVKDL